MSMVWQIIMKKYAVKVLEIFSPTLEMTDITKEEVEIVEAYLTMPSSYNWYAFGNSRYPVIELLHIDVLDITPKHEVYVWKKKTK